MRKCRHCKAELPSIKNSDTWEQAGFCTKDHYWQAELEKKAHKPAKPKPKKAKVKTIAQELDAAAVLCQRMVRLKAADDNGYCKCITCGVSKPWQQMQGGHFIERGKKATKIDETNIHPQCQQDNMWGMKNTTTVLAYRNAMIDMYGSDYVDDLVKRSKEPFKPSREWIAEQVEYFKEQIDFHEKRLGVSK
jgi:hypothetical protein